MAVVVASVRWLQEQVRGDTPSPRHGHAVSRIGDELYLFGGCSAKSEVIQGEEKKSKQNGDNVIFYNDLYKIEITSLEWHRLTQVGDIPSKRDGHSLCTIGKHLYLFGGKDHLLSIRNLKGLYLFDPHSLNWEKCETEGPEPRSLSNTVNVLKDKIYVFGGIHRSRASNNMWMLDTSKFLTHASTKLS
ncbi:host cell factor 2-like [Saccoglossus kowalevskii]